jgi:hypothetical protein
MTRLPDKRETQRISRELISTIIETLKRHSLKATIEEPPILIWIMVTIVWYLDT